MKRRGLLGAAGLLAAASALPRPAVAQERPELDWRLTAAFSRQFDGAFTAAEVFAGRVAALSEGRFRIKVFAAGEIVAGSQALDAVSGGSVECAFVSGRGYWSKDPAFVFLSGLPFGLNARQQQAWWKHRGGAALLNEFLAPYEVHAIAMGNLGAEMGGWFRRELDGPNGFARLKIRANGFVGRILQRMGAVPQQMPGDEVVAALADGALDAAEWSGPYEDERLGLNRAARFYYYPGWWEGSTATHLFVNLTKWEELPIRYQKILGAAATEAGAWMLAQADARNPPALRRLLAGGTVLRPYPAELMQAAWKVADALHAEIGATNASFKKIHDHMAAYRDEAVGWNRISDHAFDAAQIRMLPKG